jgi:ubiquinone/menaquinone biosynthesis C-methylase UbiE
VEIFLLPFISIALAATMAIECGLSSAAREQPAGLRTTMDFDAQNQLIVDQFTRQAEPFARLPAHSSEASIRLISEAAEVGASDTVLDVACGPGLLACGFAATAREVTGIDLTPAMIEQARQLQQARGLTNLSWQVGDVSSLPFPDATFSLTFTRYSFHHLLDPRGVFAEMVRVTKPGGRVVVVDVYTTSPEQAEAYDRVERLRDPSHVRALGLEELRNLFQEQGLRGETVTTYGLDVSLEEILGASFPDPAAADEIRRIFAADLNHDRLGVGARREQGEFRFAFPTAILCARKPRS